MYKRIIILGGSGSGKSTLANRISSYTHYPVYHLDNMLLNSDWTVKDKTTWEEISKEFLLKDVGIVDGNYSSSIPNRLKWADLVILVDAPTRVLLYRVFKRYIRVNLGLDFRHGRPEESREKLRASFINWVYNWNKSHREKILSMLKSAKDKKVAIIKNPKEVNIESLLN